MNITNIWHFTLNIFRHTTISKSKIFLKKWNCYVYVLLSLFCYVSLSNLLQYSVSWVTYLICHAYAYPVCGMNHIRASFLNDTIAVHCTLQCIVEFTSIHSTYIYVDCRIDISNSIDKTGKYTFIFKRKKINDLGKLRKYFGIWN